jgi:hypothetical protein
MNVEGEPMRKGITPGKHGVVALVVLVSTLSVGITDATGSHNGIEDRIKGGRRLLMVWHDAHGLAPGGTFRGMVREVERVFGPLALDIEWMKAELEEPALDERTVLLRIVLMPSEPSGSDWGLEEDVMGAVLPGDGRSRSLYVFYKNLTRAVKIDDHPDRLPDIRELRGLARALGRVVAHEMVHAVAPSQRHSSRGLMREGFGYSFLIKDEVALDDRLKKEFLSGIDGILVPPPGLQVATGGSERRAPTPAGRASSGSPENE